MTRATYRRVLTTFWTDPDIRRKAKDPESLVVLLNLFTGPRSTLSGLYYCPLDYVAFETRVDRERVEEIIESFEGDVLEYDPETEEVFVRAAFRHNVGEQWKPKDNRTKGAIRQVMDTHSDELVGAIVDTYSDWDWPEKVLEKLRDSRKVIHNSTPEPAEGASKDLPASDDAAYRSFPHALP